MKKSIFLMAVMAACLSLPAVFTSCGSDSSSDDPDDIIVPQSKTTRLEIKFSGDYSYFYPTVGFVAYEKEGAAKTLHTSDGTDVDLSWSKDFEEAPFSSVSAQIAGSYLSFTATIMLAYPSYSEGDATARTAVVVGNVYKDEKLSISDTIRVTLSPSDPSAVYLFSEEEENGFTRQDLRQDNSDK